MFNREALGLLFSMASTGTRISFQVVVNQMAGYSEHLNTNDLQLSSHESLKDTAAVLGRYLDGLLL